MDSSDFTEYIDYLSSFGFILSPEEKAALQSSLVILRNEQKAQRVRFWGKILGIKENYYIAQCIGKDELSDKKTFYSLDAVRWVLLTPATRESRTRARMVKGRFSGDPAYDFEYFERTPAAGEDPPPSKSMKEEERLAGVISDIDEEVSIVPRRAYLLTPQGRVSVNRSFDGLTLNESVYLPNYLHFREPSAGGPENPSPGTANYDRATDFLDAIDQDIPRGSWAMQCERGSGLVLLASLKWPGYAFFHVPGTRKFGAAYMGLGEPNRDLPFMLP